MNTIVVSSNHFLPKGSYPLSRPLTKMKTCGFYFVVKVFLLALQSQSAFGQEAVLPTALNEFWNGIEAAWMPAKENDIWTDKQRETVRQYCEKFAKSHAPQSLIPAMIEGLSRRPSEVNAFIYTWVVLNWNAQEVKVILTPFYDGNDPIKKQIAADFIASIEEVKESGK